MNKQKLELQLDNLIENARLLGTFQAKKAYGCYTQQDARFEQCSWEMVNNYKRLIMASAPEEATI